MEKSKFLMRADVSIENVNDKEVQLSIDEKKPQNVQNSFMTIEEMPVVVILFFKMRPTYNPRQAFIMMNMSCRFEKSTYNESLKKAHQENCPSAKMMDRKIAHQFFKISLQRII